MPDVEDLITDLASIVTSVRPREVMTLKRIEEDYKAIYGKSIPFYDHGYSSVSDLLENFPKHFKFSMAGGMLVVRTNIKNNITALIATERNSKKSCKNFTTKSSATTLFKKHKRREMKIDPELPATMLKSVTEMLSATNYNKGIPKSNFLKSFHEHAGYECKYLDYGFADEYELFQYLSGRVCNIRGNIVHQLNDSSATTPSLFDLLRTLLASDTGFTLSSIQERLSTQTSERISALMRPLGHVNFVDVIYEASSHGLLSYDHDLVYSPLSSSQPRKPRISVYPCGVSVVIRVINAVSPSNFAVEIIGIDGDSDAMTRDELHREMQRLTPMEPLLSMFKENRYCSVEYDGEWYRSRVIEMGTQSVRVKFGDFPFEMGRHGEVDGGDGTIEVSLPTNRLRFVPRECESVPNYVHRCSLAYVCADGGRQWSRESVEAFQAFTSCPDIVYRSFLVDQKVDSVSVDVVAISASGDRCSLFQRMVQEGFAQSSLQTM